MDASVRIRAIKFIQHEKNFYLAVLPASDLLEIAGVDTWNADSPPEETGYQRAPSLQRKKQIADYISRPESILPQGGLLNARSEPEDTSPLSFQPDPGQAGPIQSGWLDIPYEKRPLYVVDMQHRLYGVGHAIENAAETGLEDFPLAVTIADGLTKMEEVEQFELINTTQKKVRTDLARRLLSLRAQQTDLKTKLDQAGKLWEAKGPMVADWLNRHGDVWKDRIQPPNKSKKECPETIAKETSFVTSLKPILQTPLFNRMAEDDAAGLINKYWNALADIFPEAFLEPKEYVIQKTPGIFSLHRIAPDVFELARTGSGISEDDIKAKLKPLESIGSEFWHRENEDGAAQFGSMKGFGILAGELRSYLPEIDVKNL